MALHSLARFATGEGTALVVGLWLLLTTAARLDALALAASVGIVLVAKGRLRQALIACAPVLLKLIFKIVKAQRPYEYKPESLARLKQLEQEYQAKYPDKAKKSKKLTRQEPATALKRAA